MEKSPRKLKVHCFTTTNPNVKIAVYCVYGYWRDSMFAYYIRGLPLIKHYGYSLFEAASQYDDREAYSATSRYNKKDFNRVVTLLTKATTDLEQNTYNDTTAAYWLNIVLDRVVARLKACPMPQNLQNLRIQTADDKNKPTRAQSFVCSTTT